MAIISCPECSEKISDTVNSCIHCGCKITHCTECGEIFVGECDSCPNCGFVFKAVKITKEQVEKEDDVQDTRSLHNKWKKESTIRSAYDSRIVSLLLFIPALIFVILAFKNILEFSNPNSLDALFDAEDRLSTIQTFLILATVFYSISSLYGRFGPHLALADMCSWIRLNNVNVVSVMDKTMNLNYKEMSADAISDYADSTEFILDSEIYSKNESIKQKVVNTLLIKSLISIVAISLICAFLVKGAERYMQTVILFGADNFKLSSLENWWLLVVAGAVFVIGIVFSFASDETLEKPREKWIDDNIPQHARTYRVYVSNHMEQVFDKTATNRRDRM